MNKKKCLAFLSIVLAILLCAPVSVVAATSDKPSARQEKIIFINGPEDILHLTEKDVIGVHNQQRHSTPSAPNVQLSYWKEIYIDTQLQNENATVADFPQSVYYTEACPYAPTTARGTLGIIGIAKYAKYGYFVYYAGLMYYYVD